MKCGKILRIKVLGYADGLALVYTTVEQMTTRLNAIANTSEEQADMTVNMSKTMPQHFHKRQAIKATSAAAEAKYQHKYDFCSRRFKTQDNMLKHRTHCVYNYDTMTQQLKFLRLKKSWVSSTSRTHAGSLPLSSTRAPE